MSSPASESLRSSERSSARGGGAPRAVRMLFGLGLASRLFLMARGAPPPRAKTSASSVDSRPGVKALLCALTCLFAAAPVLAQFQMPDPKQMSGIPRPVDDLPSGSVSVRLIRGELSNNIANHPVELHIG